MRILSVDNSEDFGRKRVWFNNKEVTNQAWQAKVPNRAGVTGIGWVDRFKEDAEGNVIFIKANNGPGSYRSHGLVRWAERT